MDRCTLLFARIPTNYDGSYDSAQLAFPIRLQFCLILYIFHLDASSYLRHLVSELVFCFKNSIAPLFLTAFKYQPTLLISY